MSWSGGRAACPLGEFAVDGADVRDDGPTPAGACRLRWSAAGGRLGQVRASVTPGPASSSPSKNAAMPAGEWLYQVAAVYSAASCPASSSPSNRAQDRIRQLPAASSDT